jgi:hypothetical protein
MARRQMYDDVMDVALRQTLIDHGFTRKTRRDYFLERPGRVWIFEVTMAPDPEPGFEAEAAVFVPELDAILKRYVPGFLGHHAPSRNRATESTSIPRLMEVEAGHRFYTVMRGRNSKNWTEAYERAQADPVMRYQYRSYWTLPQFSDLLKRNEPGNKPDWKEGVRESGLFLDEQWRAHIWDWYHKCDDPMFIVHWIEIQRRAGIDLHCSLAVLCHMAGNADKARFYLQRRIEESHTTYEELYKELHRENRGNWLRRLWGSGWSEEEVVDVAEGRLQVLQEAAEAARKLAAGFGIRLD